MAEKTKTADTDEQQTDTRDHGTVEPVTSGHVERTILNQMVTDDGRYVPTTVSGVLEAVAAVVERGDYGNLGPRSPESVVRKSTIRRAFTQLEEKGLVQRIEELPADDLAARTYALGECTGDDPTDPAAYTRVTDDARVTDWILTDEGSAEIGRLDSRYAAQLHELAARFGRPAGETTRRIDP